MVWVHAGLTNENYANSWVDIKGSSWVVRNNTGVSPLTDGFHTLPRGLPLSGGWPGGCESGGLIWPIRGSRSSTCVNVLAFDLLKYNATPVSIRMMSPGPSWPLPCRRKQRL